MKRRNFLQLFIAIPAVAMANRALPAVLGEPEYLAAGKVDAWLTIYNGHGESMGRLPMTLCSDGRHFASMVSAEILGTIGSMHMEFRGNCIAITEADFGAVTLSQDDAPQYGWLV